MRQCNENHGFLLQVHRALDMDKVLVLEAGQVKEFDSPARLAADRSFTKVNRMHSAHCSCLKTLAGSPVSTPC